MTLTAWEAAARLFEKPTPKWRTPGEMARVLNPKTVQTPALDLIDEKLVHAFNTPDSRLIISMPPQEGKSTRVAQEFLVWALTQNPDLRIITASYSQDLANRNGVKIRNMVRDNTSELGIAIAPDNGSMKSWTLAGHEGGVFAAGITAGVTGRAADMLVIDDPFSNRQTADSPLIRERVWDWWTAAASARLAPGAPVIMILTRWHYDDLAGRFLTLDKDAGWEYLNIPAQADHRPEQGETDPLGREPGEFMDSARKRSLAQWERRKKTAGPRDWASLYQGRPTPGEGGIFPHEWPRYEAPLWEARPDGTRVVPSVGRDDVELIQSWDMAFKDSTGSDYVVGQVWLRNGPDAYLLDMVRARLSFTATLDAVRGLSAKWPQALAKLVEDKANGSAVINTLKRTHPGMIAVEPEGSKVARANSVSYLAHAANVHLPTAELLPNVEELVEEARGFPAGKHDDAVDAMTQALNQLYHHPLGESGVVVEPDMYDDVGWSISPY